jgi:succinate dehydrogenase / fumarate reductase cytochrome b subunit
MRFYLYPTSVNEGATSTYFVRLDMDPGLYTVASRLNVALYDQTQIAALEKQLQEQRQQYEGIQEEARSIQEGYQKGPDDLPKSGYSAHEEVILNQEQLFHLREAWFDALTKRKINSHQVIAASKEFGTALLLNVRNAFKSPFECILYTIFVLSAVFHAFNGLWTFCITWGIVLKMRSQRQAVNVCIGLMALMGFLGLMSIWGTYWINLRQ